jgi:CheY-like chemotaxis protein
MAGPTRTRVLVIDDDEITLIAICDLLDGAGFATEALATPLGAMRRLTDGGFAAVVVDLHMPSLTGDRFAEMLRRWRRSSPIPIVVVSGAETHTFEHIVAHVPRAHALSKSSIKRELVAHLRRVVAADVGAGQD